MHVVLFQLLSLFNVLKLTFKVVLELSHTLTKVYLQPLQSHDRHMQLFHHTPQVLGPMRYMMGVGF